MDGGINRLLVQPSGVWPVYVQLRKSKLNAQTIDCDIKKKPKDVFMSYVSIFKVGMGYIKYCCKITPISRM